MEVSHILSRILILILNTLTPSFGLYGYDCGSQLSNLTTISVVYIGECNIREPRINTTKTYGQLLQINDFGTTQVFKCTIKLTRVVTHCGMHSHASRMQGGEISYYPELSKEECLSLYHLGHINVAGTKILGIKKNSTVQKTVTFAGSSDSSGKCVGESFSDPYGSYQNVYVAGWVEITLQDYYTEVHLESNRIILKSGLSCVFLDTTCTDVDAGYVFWSLIPEGACGVGKYSVLYEGNIDKIYDEEEKKLMYTLETEDTTFAILKTGGHKACGYKFSCTEHPKLFILENARETSIYRKTERATANLDIFTYVNSKFLYVEKHMKGQLNRMYFDVLKNKCELEKQVMTNALALASISPEEVGFRIMRQYLAVVTGEVIHLLKCLKVEVTERKTEKCYNELPIFKGSEEGFLSPRTHILLRTGKEIICDQRLPAMYKVNNIWYKLLPNPIEVKDPEILKPQTKPTWKYTSPHSLAISGIYTYKDTNRLKDMILFPIERPSVLNKVALGMSGREIDVEGMTITSFLDQKILTKIAESTWNKFWASFLAFGTTSVGIIGVIMIYRLIKLLVDTIIHGYAINSLYGFSIHLMGAIWNSVTQLMLHLANQKARKEENRENEGDRQMETNKKVEQDIEKKGEAVEKEIIRKELFPELNIEKGTKYYSY